MSELEVITQSKLENYLKIAGVAQSLTKEEQTNFLQIAMDFNLNPFKREIYCTSYGKGDNKKTSIIIGYEVYIKRAERTNQLDGWQVVTTGSVKGNDLKATITIYRKDRKFPFIHEVDYSEYVQTTFEYDHNGHKVKDANGSYVTRPNKMWAEKPITMLKKVATAQGFRLCFSDELGGMPFDSSELPGEEKEIQIDNQQKAIESLPVREEKEIPRQKNIIEEYFDSLPKESKLYERVNATVKWIEENEEISIKQAAYDKLAALWETKKAWYIQKELLNKWEEVKNTIPTMDKAA
jgi:phage recombination protein Bet